MSNNNLKVRKLEERDISKILDLLTQVNLLHYNNRPDIFKKGTKFEAESLKKTFIGNDLLPVFVCVDADDQVLGHAFCQIKDTPESTVLESVKTLYIDDICVDENARKMGVGNLLYDFIYDYAMRDGTFDSITLNVWNFNQVAYEFYLKMGLSPQRTIMEKRLEDDRDK